MWPTYEQNFPLRWTRSFLEGNRMTNSKKHWPCLVNESVTGFSQEIISGHLGTAHFILVVRTKVHLKWGKNNRRRYGVKKSVKRFIWRMHKKWTRLWKWVKNKGGLIILRLYASVYKQGVFKRVGKMWPTYESEWVPRRLLYPLRWAEVACPSCCSIASPSGGTSGYVCSAR